MFALLLCRHLGLVVKWLCCDVRPAWCQRGRSQTKPPTLSAHPSSGLQTLWCLQADRRLGPAWWPPSQSSDTRLGTDLHGESKRGKFQLQVSVNSHGWRVTCSRLPYLQRCAWRCPGRNKWWQGRRQRRVHTREAVRPADSKPGLKHTNSFNIKRYFYELLQFCLKVLTSLKVWLMCFLCVTQSFYV